MKKKIFKYTIRIVVGLFTLFWGLATWATLTPAMEEYPCEPMKVAFSATTYALIAAVSLITLCFVWYRTKDW